jgi:hypothetical protein
MRGITRAATKYKNFRAELEARKQEAEIELEYAELTQENEDLRHEPAELKLLERFLFSISNQHK